MQYKGEDLDLRVPHGRTPRETYVPDYETSNGRWGRGQAYPASPDPVWVDEVLLACCNYAFDVAQANGSGEVALEHLVNAMTRVDSAARQLEARGVREGQLRRESAALIASEIPAANAGDALAPRRSPELEDVLRRAADLAQRRSAPASVDDVLWVILHSSRETPVVMLLRRLTPDWQRADWGRLREPPMPEPMPRAVQLVANDGVNARMASMEDSFRLMQAEFAADRKLLMDLVRDIQRDVVAQRGDAASFRNDLGQRLDGIERTVHTRGDVRMADRLAQLEKAVHGSLLEAQRGSRELGQRLAALETSLVDHSPGHDSLADRMALLEKAVHSGLGEGARNWANLGQRLNQLEAAVERHETPTFDALTERIGGLERTVQQSLADGARNHGVIGQRLAAFETLLGDSSSSRLGEALQTRLTAIERRLEAETQGLQGRLQERFGELARLFETSRGSTPNDVADRLSSIETCLMESPTSSTDLAPVRELTERVAGLERAVRTGFGEAATTTSQIAERLVAVERGVTARPSDESEAALLLDDRLGAIERMLDTRGQQALSINTQISERLGLLEKRPVGEGGVATLGAEAFAPVNQRVEALQASIGAISTRLDQLDERMRTEAGVTEEALRGRDQDFDFIYNEIKQLGQSQATLNSAVNDWRNESQEHFGALATRLDKLASPQVLAAAAEAARPIVTPFEVPDAIKPRDIGPVINGAANGPHLPKPTNVSAQDYSLPSEPGRGFWYWLFGTSRVWKANRDNEIKVDRMRQGIRDARERRRTQA